MRWHVDGWNPAYGTSFNRDDDDPDARSSAKVDTAVEVPDDAWRPIPAPPQLPAPDVVLLVDGVRRIDATLWSDEGDGISHPGVAASYAAGVVRCDLRNGRADVVGWQVDRGLFTTSPTAPHLTAGQVTYRVQRLETTDPSKLERAVQPALTELEVVVSDQARSSTPACSSTVDGSDLLVVDGPLRKRRNLTRTIGYIKSHHRHYLSARHTAVVTSLGPGQRSPVFREGTMWDTYSWYLRLPGRPGAPWAGIARVECSTELTKREAIALANMSTVVLPRFASAPYKDPRAPQNLLPIAGLERRLRALLGDPRLLHRSLMVAAATATAAAP